ncbi:alpha/beta fold hydrolase [Streptomyces sp. PTM05]|uniref:Alpha/beta fold hydrolase n=1 Tax=Streptantibioticus parmotrematis TaxID=2873249 RepID=A0ABS7QSD6_9ACTN|nr:alpha/beta fold hydrolase [Streptantibioticus parmotrematis]MBY8886106.1 alpha/beta fold hydrolase [Streptantibioticus parmotrematis]
MSATPSLREDEARRLPGYPFRGHWFDHGNWRQHYVDEGRGAPVLFVHGNPAWSYLWRGLIQGLRGGYRCVAPDHMGLGLSDRAREHEGSLCAERRAEDLARLVEHLVANEGAPERGWTLVVHDWGGPIGLMWARSHPGMVDRLVVLNTAAFPWPAEYRLPLGLRAMRHWPAGPLAHYGNVMAHAAVRVGVCRRLPQAVRAAYLAPYRRPRDRRAVGRFVREIPLRPSDPGWARAQWLAEGLHAFEDLPCFVGWGMRDPVFNDVVLAEWTQRLPQGRFHLYPFAGHYVMEDAADQLLSDLTSFLSATDRAVDRTAPPRSRRTYPFPSVGKEGESR